MIVPRLEKDIGIEVYATPSPGIGGAIRRYAEDFVVEEVLVDGSHASTKQPVVSDGQSVLGSSLEKKDRYLLCVLVKQNWDTFSAIKTVAEKLGISQNRIQIAGIKDAKALTAQHVTIEGISVSEAEKIRFKDLQLYPVGYVRQELSAYYLLGNSFHITISLVNCPETTMKKRVLHVAGELEQLGGVPNFFGHQRFGTTRPITHLVGKELVKGNFRKAVMLFLAKPSVHEHPASRKAREELRATLDFERALRDFPKQLRYERLMLKHLVANPKDFVGAFRRLPKKLQELFPQAYQSYLFNRFLSRRLSRGLSLNKTEIGDYVVSVDKTGLPLPVTNRKVTMNNKTEVNSALQTGKMRLAIPLVGFKQRLSEGVQGEIERQVLNEEKVQTKNFKIENLPELSLRGGLRTTTVQLSNFALEEASRDPTEPSKRLVKISFTLPRGAYATIVLREVMKPRNLIKSGF
ncbi:MAG: tRNA pseudouridine(13) synthase TruD [Candidatus Bathyarchaeia archaeon]